MKKSILLTALLGALLAGCASTELQEAQPLNPPQSESESMQALMIIKEQHIHHLI